MNDALEELQGRLEVSRNEDRGTEFWYARDLQSVLGYATWESFERVLHKAVANCRTVGLSEDDHFRQVTKMIVLGKGAKRDVTDYALSRYGAHLIAVNADAGKPNVAFIKNYFVVQARKQELVEQRVLDTERLETRQQLKASEKVLSGVFQERGLDGKQMSVVRSKGDTALFGGLTTKQMKERYNITATKPLADVLPTLTISAKTLINEMTKLNLDEKNLRGEPSISKEHVQNSEGVRRMLSDRGIQPEDLPAAEDIGKVERRLKSEERALSKSKLPIPENIL